MSGGDEGFDVNGVFLMLKIERTKTPFANFTINDTIFTICPQRAGYYDKISKIVYLR